MFLDFHTHFPYFLHSLKWETAHKLIQKTLSKALRNACGWPTPKAVRPILSIWLPICGFPPVLSFLRQLKLEFAARLKLADHKAARAFRALLEEGKGTFEIDTKVALNEWLLRKRWECLDDKALPGFKRKVQRLAKKNWPYDLPRDGLHKWLYHNHCRYSGNVPAWASWTWPESTNWKRGQYECHFYCLLTGTHPAMGGDSKCLRHKCQGSSNRSLYEHHFFECGNFIGNRDFFKAKVLAMCEASEVKKLALPLLERILSKPSEWWIGMIESWIFDLGVKITLIHELHRILTIASVLSWGRFYRCPIIPGQSGFDF